MGLKRRRIYNVMGVIDQGQPITRRPESGGFNRKIDQRKTRSLVAAVSNKTGVSQRKLAHKFGVTQSCISKTLKRNAVLYFKRRKAPKATDKQKVIQRERLSRLTRKIVPPKSQVDLLLDDESYFTFTFTLLMLLIYDQWSSFGLF